MNSTKVGFGQNKGNGTPSENQQPIDMMGRYADVSDNFINEMYLSVNLDPSFEDADPSSADMESAYKTINDIKGKLPNIFNSVFEKSVDEFSSCLCALGNCFSSGALYGAGLYVTYEGHNYFDGWCVHIDANFILCNGSKYNTPEEVMQHEFTHMIDYLGNGEAWGKPMSSSIVLTIDGQSGTLLDFADRELGYLDQDFQRFVYDHENPRIAELMKQKKNKREAFDGAVKAFSDFVSKYGMGNDYAEYLFDSMDDYILMANEDSPNFDVFLPEGYGDFVHGFMKTNEFQEAKKRYKEAVEWEKRYNEARNSTTADEEVEWIRKFFRLNDIMSATNRSPAGFGRWFDKFGRGHDQEYYMSNEKRGLEIFANITPILSKEGEAKQWLEEHAPRTVKAYYALMRLAKQYLEKEASL